MDHRVEWITASGASGPPPRVLVGHRPGCCSLTALEPTLTLAPPGTILRSEALAACATWKSELASGNVPSQKTSMCTVL